jgi:hypothetical protein
MTQSFAEHVSFEETPMTTATIKDRYTANLIGADGGIQGQPQVGYDFSFIILNVAELGPS